MYAKFSAELFARLRHTGCNTSRNSSDCSMQSTSGISPTIVIHDFAMKENVLLLAIHINQEAFCKQLQDIRGIIVGRKVISYERANL